MLIYIFASFILKNYQTREYLLEMRNLFSLPFSSKTQLSNTP